MPVAEQVDRVVLRRTGIGGPPSERCNVEVLSRYAGRTDAADGRVRLSKNGEVTSRRVKDRFNDCRLRRYRELFSIDNVVRECRPGGRVSGGPTTEVVAIRPDTRATLIRGRFLDDNARSRCHRGTYSRR